MFGSIIKVLRGDTEKMKDVVSPCYRFLHSYPEYVFGRPKQITAHSFGSLSEQSLLEIWTTPEFMRYRYNVLHGEYPSCPDCQWIDGCDMALNTDMDCLGNAPSCGDCLWGRGITVCHTLKEIADKGIDLYCSLPILSTYLGHSSITATEKYLRLTEELYPYIIKRVHDTTSYVYPEVHIVETY